MALRTIIYRAWLASCIIVAWLGCVAYLLGFDSIEHLVTGVGP